MRSDRHQNLHPESATDLIERALSSLTSLAPLLDDLDGLGGGDGDSGTNAVRSLRSTSALAQREIAAGNELSLADWAALARTGAVGHSGMIFATWLTALQDHTHNGVIRPVELSQFYRDLPAIMGDAFVPLHPDLRQATLAVARAAATEGRDLVDPLRLADAALVEVLDAIVEATSSWPDPGTCVFAILTSVLASYYAANHMSLSSPANMIRDLATTASGQAHRQAEPSHALYSVDFVIEGVADSIRHYHRELQATHSVCAIGTTNAMGVHTWRYHVNTDYPMRLRFPQGWRHSLSVTDSRPADQVGYDELAVQEEASGVIYLTRPTRERAATASVYVILTDLHWAVQASGQGAHAFIDPKSGQDVSALTEALRHAEGGTPLIVYADPAYAAVIERSVSWCQVETNLQPVIVPCPDEFSAALVAGECAGIFLPQSTAQQPEMAAHLLRSRAQQMLTRLTDVELVNRDETWR